MAQNKKCCRLWKQHKKASRSIVNWSRLSEYDAKVFDYENRDGKFIPDAENTAWFAMKAPRIAELMKVRQIALKPLRLRHDHPDMTIYLRAAAAFKNEFGHTFTADDGCDHEFKRMESHAASAQALFALYTDDEAGLTVAISEPLTFEVNNPYPGDDPRQVAFEEKLRELKDNVEGHHSVGALPASINKQFPFSLENSNGLLGHYNHTCEFLADEILNMGSAHWEDFHGCIDEGFLAQLAVYDAEQAHLVEQRRQQTSAAKAAKKARKAADKAADKARKATDRAADKAAQQTIKTAKKADTAAKPQSAKPKSRANDISIIADTDVESEEEEVQFVATPARCNKGKDKQQPAPPRKKTKRPSGNVSPAVPSGRSTPAARDFHVHIFMEPNMDAITALIKVADMERFRFSVTPLFTLSNAGAPLKLGDSKIAALVSFKGISYYIITNANYIPALPIRPEHSIFMRDNCRFGDDDYTLWPQQYNKMYCHLGAIHQRVTDNNKSLSCMWWDVTRNDFICPESGRAIIRGLGKLRGSQVAHLMQGVAGLIEQCGEYERSLQPPNKPSLLFAFLINQLKLSQDWLQMACNRLVSRPVRRGGVVSRWGHQPLESCRASACALSPAPLTGYDDDPREPYSMGEDIDMTDEDFEEGELPAAAPSLEPPQFAGPSGYGSGEHSQAAGPGSSRNPRRAELEPPLFAEPSSVQLVVGPTGEEEVERWCDTTPPTNKVIMQYVFPEPALIVSPADKAKRQLFLHHMSLLRPALFFCMGDDTASRRPLGSQAWRDVLFGKMNAENCKGKGAERGSIIDEVLGPALRVCSQTQALNFPAEPGSFAPISTHRAQEIVWEVAEANFRFELLSLDHQATCREWPYTARQCFAGGGLMDLPLRLSKEGLAAASPGERHPYILQMARIMTDWEPRTPDIMGVTAHYTQRFFTVFGRAPVILMCLEHDLSEA
ncbi:hypothetical protein B0H17DRAFT_1333643 [Mycena rosella]|uniref:Uncharacterized protein n=1 Tax=Mycena rosella TaxID=1033263 RepID=A0AAD7D873_MYCRO|nr:hypothetical protein B0H17DRAFT_1333643 [Mycena rosella]